MEISTYRRPMKVTGIVAATASLAFLAGCGGSFGGSDDSGSTDEPFTIGVIAPLTGVVSLEGNALLRGFELGVDRVNAEGGILGQDIEVVVVDDMSSAANSTQAAQRLTRENDVDYLFGTIAGDTAAAVAAVANDAGVPFSGAIAGTIDYCSAGYWHFGASESLLLDALVEAMAEEWGPNVAFVGNDYAFPRGYANVARDAIEANGGEVVLEEYSPLGTSDWQPVIAKIQAADPDWILNAVVGGDAIAFSQQAEQFGILANRGFAGTTHQQEFYDALGNITEGGLAVLPYTDQIDSEANREFVEAYRAEYDFEGPIPAVSATSYDAVQFIADAVNAAGSYEMEAIVDQLGKTQLDGVVGQGHFDPETHRWAQNMYLVRIEAGGIFSIVEDLGIVTDERAEACV